MDRKVSCISRSGIVSEVTTDNITVNIVNMSACSECTAKELCTTFERKEKTIFVHNSGQNVQPGDAVNVAVKTGVGMKAVLLAYFMPILVITAILLFLLAMGTGELYAGIISVGTLAGYYFVIYLIREKLRKQFYFYIEKAD
jgi:sigma-E factor negative regulatory protein RseC